MVTYAIPSDTPCLVHFPSLIKFSVPLFIQVTPVSLCCDNLTRIFYNNVFLLNGRDVAMGFFYTKTKFFTIGIRTNNITLYFVAL